MSYVWLVDSMGTDLTVANAARVSFGKRKDKLDDQDKRLIGYLAKHNHWTPFAHCVATVHIRAPVFVRAQLAKHTVGVVMNEESRRYVDTPPEFYEPEIWRERAKDKKQGSKDTSIFEAEIADTMYHDLVRRAADVYDGLIKLGVAPEQARMVLPQSMYTEWWWTGSLAAYARICKLRLAPDAQKETRDVAVEIDKIMKGLYPVSWEALIGVT